MPTKQEEIIRGLRTEFTFSVEDTEYWEMGDLLALKGKAITKLLDYLDSKGVVLKVEHTHEGHTQCEGCYWQSRTVEPLIREDR